MKVYTVEWHEQYDGGEVLCVFDSKEKAETWLKEAALVYSKAQSRRAKFTKWMQILKPLGNHFVNDSDGRPHYASEEIRKWHRLWGKVCNLPQPYWGLPSYDIFEYEVR